MSKTGKVGLSDLTLAPRRAVTKPGDSNAAAKENMSPAENEEVRSVPAPIGRSVAHTPQKKTTGRGLLATAPEERRQEAIEKAIDREDTASRLRNLKKTKARESRHFINIPLDWETKKALEDAAHEHGLKMTVIVRDALSIYLKDAGYLRS